MSKLYEILIITAGFVCVGFMLTWVKPFSAIVMLLVMLWAFTSLIIATRKDYEIETFTVEKKPQKEVTLETLNDLNKRR